MFFFVSFMPSAVSEIYNTNAKILEFLGNIKHKAELIMPQVYNKPITLHCALFEVFGTFRCVDEFVSQLRRYTIVGYL